MLKWIWFADMVLAAIAAFLAVAALLSVVIRNASEKNYRMKLQRIQENMRRRAGGKTAAALEISGRDMLEIQRRSEEPMSRDLDERLGESLRASGKTAEMEKTAANGRSRWKRVEAVICLGYIRSPRTLEILAACLHDKDESVSYYAALALWRVGTPEAAAVLLEYLARHPSKGQKIASLLETFPSLITSEIQRSLESRQAHARFWAVKLLSKFKPASAAARVRELTEDVSPDVRAAACECLGSLGDKDARESLIERLKDPEWFVRMHAARALAIITGDNRYREMGKEPR